MSFKSQPKGFATKAIHVGQNPDQWSSLTVVCPIVTATTFKQEDATKFGKYLYSRWGNPTRNVLEQVIASLDNAKYGFTFSSGMGAITTIAQLLSAGDHLICGADVYGGTYCLYSEVSSRQGLKVDFVDCTDLDKIKAAINKDTKMLWMESPTNPLMKIIDIEAVCKICHDQDHKIIVAVDNTFMSSYFQRPLELGVDIVMYSLSKYMNGHSDVLMGGAVTNDEDLHQRLRFLQGATGIVPSPFDCYQVNRGLKTLSIRMEEHSRNSLEVAQYLEKHSSVEKVLHPALPSHPQHEIALRQSYGHSGTFSFYLKGGLSEATKFLQSLKVFALAVSLGGYESLAQLPAVMTHANVPAAERLKMGITDGLIRLSVGLEDSQVLIKDIEQALNCVAGSSTSSVRNWFKSIFPNLPKEQ